MIKGENIKNKDKNRKMKRNESKKWVEVKH